MGAEGFDRIHKRPPPVPVLIQSMPSHPTIWGSILILSTYLLLGLPDGFFPSWLFHEKPVCTSPFPTIATCPACFILDLITRMLFSEVIRLLGV